MSASQPLAALLALAAVLALILLLRRVMLAFPRAFGALAPAAAAPDAGRLRLGVEQTIALGPRRRLVLVRCGSRRVLLLTGGAQDVVVGWLQPESEDPAV
jgi:flagellar protein FliO/FliZ